MELLAPAGDMDSLKSAVYNGADAVYLGIKEFNARNNIDGFNLDNLAQAVDFAHLFGVKVYLALNILFKDNELQNALDIVVESNNRGVDAFIVQDLGLAHLIKKYYPSIVLHASTQMAVHNLEGVMILEKLGFERVVLSRETSMSEIERINKNSKVEIEFFVQGALCVAFSGNCYMCSHLVDKSGNRGVCQQFCRLPYKFECGDVKKSGYLLSAKDICLIDYLQDLKKIGVISLKIEGRARRQFYVAQACNVYRKALDMGKYSKTDFNKLKMAFNRDYTPAYFNGNKNIISKIQGNNGLEIGTVVKVKNGNKFNEVFIKTDYNLQAPSGLKFIYNGEELTSIGAHDIKQCGDVYRITTTSKIKVGCKVNIIQDEKLEIETLKNVIKLPIDVSVEAEENVALKICVKYKDIEICEQGDICQKSRTINIEPAQVLKQLSRTDVFEIKTFDCNLNGCYILNSSINKLRNNIYEKLKQKIINKYSKNILNKINIENITINKTNDKLFNFKIINNINNLEYCENIIFNYNYFNIDEIKLFDDYCKKNNINGFVDVPNFANEQDVNLIKTALGGTNLGVVVNNLYAFTFDCKMIGGQFLNIYNSYTLIALNELRHLSAVFVEELKYKDIDNLRTNIPIIKREKSYMTLIHCPFKQNMNCDCYNCAYNSDATFTINSGKKFKIVRKKTSSCVFMLKD